MRTAAETVTDQREMRHMTLRNEARTRYIICSAQTATTGRTPQLQSLVHPTVRNAGRHHRRNTQRFCLHTTAPLPTVAYTEPRDTTISCAWSSVLKLLCCAGFYVGKLALMGHRRYPLPQHIL